MLTRLACLNKVFTYLPSKTGEELAINLGDEYSCTQVLPKFPLK